MAMLSSPLGEGNITHNVHKHVCRVGFSVKGVQRLCMHDEMVWLYINQ